MLRILIFLMFTCVGHSQILPSQQAIHNKKEVDLDTWDSSIKPSCTTFSNNDRTAVENNCSNSWSTIYGEIPVSSGTKEWEVTVNAISAGGWTFNITLGIVNTRNNKDTYSTNKTPGSGGTSGALGYVYANDGRTETNVVFKSYGASYTAGDVIKISVDMDAGEITFYKNGDSQGVAYTGIAAGTYYLAATIYKGQDQSLTISG